ncbi:uncharacterized protein LOC114972102 isoform X2 [Acropora millepora]|uniref:uncharacterized protein LOC114972102 isoform X2 n=1 Tax=Acropora millepora TaxID=45264 RepID=UPI001CF44F8D|nr:uncharacterized protein LOC114972102 isoform X2 [Acropora millepora]
MLLFSREYGREFQVWIRPNDSPVAKCPRPDSTCNPSTPTSSVVSTESTDVSLSSSPKHPYMPESQQQNGKFALILSCVGLGSLFVFIILFGAIYCLRKKVRSRRNRDCNLRNLSNMGEERVYFETKGNMLVHPTQVLPQQQNQGFVPTPQGSHTGTPSQTDDELDELPGVESVDPKHSRRRPGRTRRRPGRTEEIRDDSLRENHLDNKDVENAQTSGIVDGKDAQSGHERKHSISGQILRRLSSISNDYQLLPVEDPDVQPAEVSAGGPQRKRSRGNSLLNALRKSSIHAVKEENPDRPSDVTIQLVTNGPKIPQANSRVEFQCTVRGCQQVFYRWYKDEQELQEEDKSTLILDPLKVQDFGFYKCEVRSDKRYDSICVESNVVDLDVTPAEGKSYRKLSEVFNSDMNLKEAVANLLEKETTACRKAYKHVAFHYNMKGIDHLEVQRKTSPGEDVLVYLETALPDLTVYHFCKVLKGENIRRLDIVKKLVDYLI